MADPSEIINKKRFSIFVSGKVQGVFYRASTKQVCDRYGITGFVCNTADGKVHIEAEGSEEELSELLQWCKEGPPLAEVEDVQFSEIPLKADVKFRIVRF
ncbi:MAG: acylphosphatase [Flavobacteriales bacterium]|nr:acylphosphatase [Flavobacteriales bacterium]